MAASANPSSGGHSNACNGNNNGGKNNVGGNRENDSCTGGASVCNPVAGPAHVALHHNPGLSLDWTHDEQSILEDLLAKYASESAVVRYAKIAQELTDKTVRDVALRCRWMSKKENGKRRKDENNSRKNKDKKEKVTDSLPKKHSHGSPNAQSMILMESDDGISFEAIGGDAGQLLEQNAHALDQISTNFSACKIHENINLFYQARSNIVSLLNDVSDMPEIMKQMPPLPVKLNDDLANTILPLM